MLYKAVQYDKNITEYKCGKAGEQAKYAAGQNKGALLTQMGRRQRKVSCGCLPQLSLKDGGINQVNCLVKGDCVYIPLTLRW